MPAIQVKPGIHWIGVNDRTTDLFEGLWPITQEGVSYNSYLVASDKTALIDLTKIGKEGALLEQIQDVIGDRPLDYVVVNHMEPDHTGAIALLRRLFPDVVFVGTAKTRTMLDSFYALTENVQVVGEGDEIALGDKTLRFVMAPFVHWPETMVTYETTEKVAFTCDAFGGFGALRGAIFDDEYEDMGFYLREAQRYFANILPSFAGPVLKAITKLDDVDVSVIAPSHGLVWRKDPSRIVNLYRTWSEYGARPAEYGITMVWGSMYGNTEAMMNAVAEGISRTGIPLEIFDAARTHVSYMLPSLWSRRGVMIGAPTYETSLFPPVANVLDMAGHKRLRNKQVAMFGSYGWSGGARRVVEQRVEELKWQWFDAFEFNGGPTQEELRQGEDFGERFARSVLES